MADQVNLASGMAPGVALTVAFASVPRPVAAPTQPSNATDVVAHAPGPFSVTETVKSPEKAMAQVNDHLKQTGSELKFEVDKATGHQVFKVVDSSNGSVLLQVPSDEMLALARNVRVMQEKMNAAGVLVDKEG